MSGYPEYIKQDRSSPDGYQTGESSKRRRSTGTGTGTDTGEGGRVTKKRSRTACLQCRSRKSKCGTLPPDPCPNCIELGLPCKWPAEDGRSSSARSRRAQGVHGSRGSVGAMLDGIKPDILADDAMVRNGGSEWISPSIPDNSRLGSMRRYDPSPGPASAGPAHPAMLPYSLPNGFRPHGGAASSAANANANAFDAAHFVRAVTSRLPIVEEATPNDDSTSPASKSQGRVLKITWWRPHGQTAIAPGLKRITLKVRVKPPMEVSSGSPYGISGSLGTPDSSIEIMGNDGMPAPDIMRHLLDVFVVHMGAYFPSLERPTLESQIREKKGSVFLFNCIASAAARFSNHPSIALPGVKPHAYGNPFTARAKTMLGSMMTVPSRDTVAGLLLLALTAAGDDSESEVWMFVGMAARMGLDLGLHINPPSESDITSDDRRLNRLLFWSILILDHALSFGVGRPTTFPFRGITQKLPVEEDIHHDPIAPSARSAFPYAAKLMSLFGSLINALNGVPIDISQEEVRKVQEARAKAITEYSLLPPDMQWVMQNLQAQSRANQASVFVFMHLWVHTILASEHLTELDSQPRSQPPLPPTVDNGHATPSPTALWRNSARTIGDILVLCDVIDARAYLSMPLVNQCFYVAGCCYVKEIEQSRARSLIDTTLVPEDRSSQSDISHAILTSVARTNIATLQRGLQNMTKFWCGIAWIAGSLEQRIEGLPMDKLDLVGITEKMATYVSLPDAGLAGREGVDGGDVEGSGSGRETRRSVENVAAPSSGGSFPYDLNFNSLFSPADLSSFEASNITEQHVSIPQTLDPDWFRQSTQMFDPEWFVHQ